MDAFCTIIDTNFLREISVFGKKFVFIIYEETLVSARRVYPSTQNVIGL